MNRVRVGSGGVSGGVGGYGVRVGGRCQTARYRPRAIKIRDGLPFFLHITVHLSLFISKSALCHLHIRKYARL